MYQDFAIAKAAADDIKAKLAELPPDIVEDTLDMVSDGLAAVWRAQQAYPKTHRLGSEPVHLSLNKISPFANSSEAERQRRLAEAMRPAKGGSFAGIFGSVLG